MLVSLLACSLPRHWSWPPFFTGSIFSDLCLSLVVRFDLGSFFVSAQRIISCYDQFKGVYRGSNSRGSSDFTVYWKTCEDLDAFWFGLVLPVWLPRNI